MPGDLSCTGALLGITGFVRGEEDSIEGIVLGSTRRLTVQTIKPAWVTSAPRNGALVRERSGSRYRTASRYLRAKLVPPSHHSVGDGQDAVAISCSTPPKIAGPAGRLPARPGFSGSAEGRFPHRSGAPLAERQ